ncbi:MAG TPA: WD40 repeat domain-containing protein, partial [Tepidisphaeraceae bacterium]|nr:WD40 repeat domain-containing protein [Tepidisphaeraceae bacterium]
ACPPSKLYLFRKFSQRNRSTLAVAAALVLMLISTTIAAVYYGIKERTLSLQQEGQIAERNASIESQNRFIAKQERIQGETNAQLYNAYLEESSALRLARKPGYRKVVFENLHKAAALKSPAKNLDQIAAEALACLGDPIGLGLEPIPSTAAVPKSRPGIPNHFRSSQNLQHATASADGEWLAGIGPGGRIVLRQRGLDRPVKVMPVPLGGITYDMEFSPDGQHLALGCEEGAAVLSVPALTQAAFFRGDKALSVAFHPRGRLVAFTGRTISLCGIPSNRLIASFVADSAANTVMFSADEQLLLASNSRTPERILYAWPIGDTPERTNLLGHDRGILDLAYSPDGAQLTSVGRDNLLRIWNSATGALLHTCSGHESPVGCLAYHPAGNSLVSGDENGTILCWDAKTGQKLRSIPALSGQRLLRLAFDAGGNYLVAAGDGGLAAWAINRTDQKVTAENFLWLERAGIVNDMVIHPDGMHIVFLEAPGVGRRPIAPPEQQIREAGAMVFSYDLSAMAYPDILLDKPAWPQNVSLHFDPAGKILRFATPRQILAALSWPSALPITDFPEFEVSISTRSQDGRWLASIVQGKGVVIYDLESKVRWATLPMGEPQVWSLEFSPDGTRLAIGYTLGGLAIWDLTLVRATFAEFGVNVPSTAAKVPAPPRPQPLSAAAFAQILDRHRQAAKSAPPAIPQ